MKKLGVWNGVKTWHELNEPAFGHPSYNRLTMNDLGEQPQWTSPTWINDEPSQNHSSARIELGVEWE